MSDRPPLSRFMVRQGSRDFMIWDRERRDPAQINNQPMINLAKEEAVNLRDQLETYFATNIDEQ